MPGSGPRIVARVCSPVFHVHCGLYCRGAPMPTPDEYRKIAETYYRLAREAKTEVDRLALLDLAKSWLEAASREDAKSVRERRRSWRARAATTGRVFDRLRPR
jgi:hypothetical protein